MSFFKEKAVLRNWSVVVKVYIIFNDVEKEVKTEKSY